jgi:tripartite-type tricarboxylate transporter receptor subunit TctC
MTFRLLCGAALVALSTPALAQDYPTAPITIVVPFAAGGPTDTVTRLIGEPMSQALGQQIVVQNVAGAGGSLAPTQVARAEPDGYTLLMHHIGMATIPALYDNLEFASDESFETIGLVTTVPMVIVARKDFEPNTIQELIDYVKANADTVTYANAGIGSGSHLCGMLFMDAIDTQLTTVPYQGTGPALTDLVGGQVDFMCDQTTNAIGQIQAGEVKAYVVTSDQRLENLPDLPTAAEAGIEGFEIGVWHGLYAPAGTPEPVVNALSEALQTALQDETVIARFAELSTAPVPLDQATPAAHETYLGEQLALWSEIIAQAAPAN